MRDDGQMTDVDLIGVEGACDFFLGRPLDENPYYTPDARRAWRVGWLHASDFNAARGAQERARWLLDAA
jgi:ribosome modulation factor